jgi:hypothetical protein
MPGCPVNSAAHDAHLSRLREDDVPVSGRSQPRPAHPVVTVEASHRALLRLGRRCSPFNCICGQDFLDARALADHIREARDAA